MPQRPTFNSLFQACGLCVFLVVLSACETLPGLMGDIEQYGNKTPAGRSAAGTQGTIAAQPLGGDNTISISVANCFNCPMVNVLIDPDGYWQRSEGDGVITGQADPGLYNAIVQSVAAGGLYSWPERVDIIPAVQATCPDHAGKGQLFFMGLSLAGQRRQTVFDAGCAGSNYADQAANAINQVSRITPFQDILSGRVVARKTAAPMGEDAPVITANISAEGEFPFPPSLKPWGG